MFGPTCRSYGAKNRGGVSGYKHFAPLEQEQNTKYVVLVLCSNSHSMNRKDRYIVMQRVELVEPQPARRFIVVGDVNLAH